MSQEKSALEIKRAKSKKRKDFIAIAIFWIALCVECYALYTKNYTVRFYSRTIMVPMLFYRIFDKEVFFSMHFFVYLTLLLSWFGDIMNLIMDFKIQYLASAFYTLSYLVFGIVFYNFKDKKKMFVNYIFYTFFAVLAIIVFFFFYFPTLNDTLNMVHLAIHGLVLLFALIWAFVIRNDMAKIGLKYFLPAILMMIVANVVFALDYYIINPQYTIHYYAQRHTSVDAMVAICYGLYMFLYTQGIRYIKHAQVLERKNESKDDVYLKTDLK